MSHTNPLLTDAARGGVVRTEENSRSLDRLIASGLLKLHIRNEQEPISSKCYVLTSRGKQAHDASLPKTEATLETDE